METPRILRFAVTLGEWIFGVGEGVEFSLLGAAAGVSAKKASHGPSGRGAVQSQRLSGVSDVSEGSLSVETREPDQASRAGMQHHRGIDVSRQRC